MPATISRKAASCPCGLPTCSAGCRRASARPRWLPCSGCRSATQKPLALVDCDPDNILVTTGAIEANFLLFSALLGAGDHVIVSHPAYQQLSSVPRALGCEVSLWDVGQDYRFDVSALARLVRPATRLIVVNT